MALSAIVAGFLAPLAASPAGAAPVPAVTYTTGDIDGQNGWGGQGGGNINDSLDQEVVANSGAPASFRGQSWRFSNEVALGSFGDQPFSPSVANEAGETAAVNGGLSGGTRSTTYEAEWEFSSAQPGAEQSGLRLDASPDRGDGARMSLVRMVDTFPGLGLIFFDYDDAEDESCNGTFPQTTVAENLSRGTAHKVRLVMNFVPGRSNDTVAVYVDGVLEHTGGSWEDFFRDCDAADQTVTVDSLLFRSGGNSTPANAGKGFLIDNVAISTGASTFSTGFEGTLPTAPDAPTGLAATPGDGTVDLSWTAPADNGSSITGYTIYRDGDEVGTTTGATTFQDTTVVASSAPYSYTVSATNEEGEGAESSAATATVNLFWSGFEWSVLNGEAEINGDDGVDLTRGATLGESSIRIVGAGPHVPGDTPWAEFSYEDDGNSYQGIDMFIDSTGAAPNPRLSAGSLFGFELLGFARYTAPPTTEEAVFAVSPDGAAGPRTAGDHTIYAGQTSTGRIDYNADGTWYSTNFLQDQGAPFAWNDILLRWRCDNAPSVTWERDCTGGGQTVTFNSFDVGDDHDESGPTITITTPEDGEDYDLGSDVPADYACTDPSGVTACVGSVPDGVSIDTTTPGEHSFIVFGMDELGNVSSEEVTYTVTDDSGPVVMISSPTDGASYGQGQNVIADFTCQDEAGGSGIDTCVGTEDDGDAIDTSTLGSHDFTVTGTDEEGNETEVTHTYTVVARGTCLGETVTVDLALGEEPTSGDDVIQGTPDADTINALEGVDHVCGLGGADVINLGAGDDAADGGAKADQLVGGAGNDVLTGASAADVLRGGVGEDELTGGQGRDQLFGGSGADSLNGGTQRDECNGGSAIDTGTSCEVSTNIP